MLQNIVGMKKPPSNIVNRQLFPFIIETEPPPELNNCRAYLVKDNSARILVSIDRLKNDEEWLHVSVSHPDRLPTWETLVKIKNIFVGLEGEAMMFFPKQSEYVNYHPYYMHLWTFISAPSACYV